MKTKKILSIALSICIIFISLSFKISLPAVAAAEPDYNSFKEANKLSSTDALNITPVSNTRDNYERIQWCLGNYGVAKLAQGLFRISNCLYLDGDGAVLTASTVNRPTIKLASPSDAVIRVRGTNAQISLLTLNYNNQYISGAYPCKSVVQISGSNNSLYDCYIQGGNAPQDYNPISERELKSMTGVYFTKAEARGNIVDNCQIRYNTLGVVFCSGLINTGTPNVVKNSFILYNKSDGMSFPGYGQAINNRIHHNGYDCMNGFVGTPPIPIPGAGIYACDNTAGALIQNNTVYDNCGHGIDIVRSRYFVIDGNTTYDPGCRSFPSCSANYQSITYGNGMAMALMDVAYFTITNNDVINNRSYNNVGSFVYADTFTNQVFSQSGTDYSDLPSGSYQVIAFVLAEHRGTTNHTVGNTIRNNRFRSIVTYPSVGLGYFASRGTGFGQIGSTDDTYWGTDSANYFTLNNPAGSDVGSRRCGGNCYTINGSDPNTDNGQHVPPDSDLNGNDNRPHYY